MFADGPLSVNVEGPNEAPAGSTVTFTCSAGSRPDCDFHWFINNQALVLKSGPVITFRAKEENVGTYICKARNPVTNIIMYQTKSFAVGEWTFLLTFDHSVIPAISFMVFTA